MTVMTLPDTSFVTLSVPAEFPTVLHTLYGPVHKGLRAQLFTLQMGIATADGDDAQSCADVASYMGELSVHLANHAGHEEKWIDPVLEKYVPEVAEVLGAEHERFEPIFDSMVELTEEFATSTPSERDRLLAVLNLDLSRFIGGYLSHMDTEERLAMPAIEAAIGLDGVMDLHGKILGDITPDIMAQMQAFMLPAMSHPERVGMMMGVRANAPAEAFAATMSLAGSVLVTQDMARLTTALDVA